MIPARIKLVSMPWALFNRPSIQLGALKAYLESRSRKLTVETSHPYLEVASILGPEMYHWISRNPWVSEALYAPLVFPEKYGFAEALAGKYVKKAEAGIKHAFHFELFIRELEEQLLRWVKGCDWTSYMLVGFSVCFHQLFASLAAAKAIKEQYPQSTIVFGGSSCGADGEQSLLKTFRFIDHVIEGEGEKKLLALCASMAGLGNSLVAGNISSGRTDNHEQLLKKNHGLGDQLPALDELPVPDYHDYFSDQQKWFSHAPFIPVLPVEFSRGCWWNKCTFCNLNLQWCGYRSKKAAPMLHEVQTLAARHRCLDFTFVDNMLPPNEAFQFFTMTGKSDIDYNFFAEIRSARSTSPPADTFSIYRHGGLSTIQVGIEALSNSLLQKMQKGVSVIENIATMRAAQECGLTLEGNLILQFPGSTPNEVEETLAALEYVFPYRPLAVASFFLGYYSPIHKNPQEYGIMTIVPHTNYAKLFPKSILGGINLLITDYIGDRLYQRKIWRPVLRQVKKWQQFHDARRQDSLHKPLLYYRDGGDFLLIRQELGNDKILHHRLQGISRQIYLFCTQIRTESELFAEFPTVQPDKILSFLADLQKKRILFSSKNKYLALAIHIKDK